jgi:MtN3 and saliva related transmembrane protein
MLLVDPAAPSDPLVRVLGYVAGTITTLSFLPQVVRSWRTRSTADLSITWLVAFISGVTLWLVYGSLLREPPIIVANAITLGLSLVLLWIRLTSRRRT